MRARPVRAFLLCVVFGVFTSLPAGPDSARVERLRDELTSPRRDVRREAARGLARLGQQAGPALATLVESLDDPDSQVWAYSVEALAGLGPAAITAAPRLGHFLESEHVQVRYRSAYALGCIGPGAFPELFRRVHGTSPRGRAAAIRAFSWMGSAALPAAPVLLERLADAEPRVGTEAVRSLSRIGADVAPLLKVALRAGRPYMRARVLQALAGICSGGALLDDSYRAEVEALLADQDPPVRAAAVLALRELGMEPALFASRLADLLGDPSTEVRAVVEDCLLRLRPRQPAVETMKKVLRVTDDPLAFRAAELLGHMGPAANSAASMLVDALRNRFGHDCHDVLSAALGRLGPSAVEVIFEGLRDEPLGSAVFEGLVRAVVEIGQGMSEVDPERVLELCEGALGDPAANVRAAGARALAELDVVARRHSSQLIHLLDDAVCRAKVGALRAVARLPKLTTEEVAHLLRLTRNSDEEVRVEALRALPADAVAGDLELVANWLADPVASVRLGATEVLARHGSAKGSRAAVVLARALRDEVAVVRAGAARALSASPALERGVVDAVRAQLHDAVPEVREAAATALGSAAVGSAAELLSETLGELNRLLNDPETSVRRAAVQSIGRLGRRAGVDSGAGAAGADRAIGASVRALREALASEPDGDVRVLALAALLDVAADRLALLSVFIERLTDSDADVRVAAAGAIASLGEQAQAAVPVLFERLEVRSDFYLARRTLQEVNPQSVSLLLEKLAHSNYRVRRMACDSLRALKEKALAAVPDLERVVADADVQEKAKTRNDRGLLNCARKTLARLAKFRGY